MTETESESIREAAGYSLLISPGFGVFSLDFLVTTDSHECPYLPSRRAREEVFRSNELDPELYHDFMDHGFRRSGDIFYRPVCTGCRQCRSLRIPTGTFKPSKSQRRVWNKNHDVDVRISNLLFTEEKFRMYSDYLARKHPPFHGCSRKELRASIYSSPVSTVEFQYRVSGRLVAVSIVDVSSRSLSSVYVFFDLDLASRSLGTFSALKEIAECHNRGIPYYYLGFCVADCPAMEYKARFKPHEILNEHLQWQNPL